MLSLVQTDRRTTVKQYAPDLSMRGHKNTDIKIASTEKQKVISLPHNTLFEH